MRFIILFFCTAIMFLHCEHNKKKRMRALHVFTHDCIAVPGSICPRHDFYYVYNYSPADSAALIKMTDTLSIDTNNVHHSYYFYEYSNILPDTHELGQKMRDWKNYRLRKDIGTYDHYDNLIMIYSFQKSYFSKGNNFPDCIIIATKKEDGSRMEKYFIRDKITKKLIEVTEDKVRPINL